MAELSLYNAGPSTTAWLRCILYCEFDPHRGPRPVFQAPENLVSADTCDYLSDHLIASSELCGHLISVTAFGLRFVGHPEHIRDEHYERNQFMFNVCFVFDATTDVSAYQPIVKQVASDFRLMETQHRFLSSQSNHEQTQAIIQGIIHDINTLGQFSMPPTGVSDIPYFPKNNPEPIRLQQCLPRASIPEVRPHEVPVWVASKDSIKLADPLLLKLVSFFDGVSDIMTISIKSEMELEFVLAKVSWLLQREMEVVRMIDKIRLNNCYATTKKLRELLLDERLKDQCVRYCRASEDAPPPTIPRAFQFLCSLQHGKRPSEIASPESLKKNDNIDVIRLLTFGRVHRYLRRMHHWPIWTGPSQSSITASRKEPAASQGNNGKDLTAKLLSLCDGSRCYDAIACAIGLSIEEVENECTNGAHKEEIIIICRMSAAGSNPDNP